MDTIKVMMVDDEPLIRKAVKMEMNERSAEVEKQYGDLSTEKRRVEMVDTFASGPSLMAALETAEAPDYLLVDMEFQGEPTGGLFITRRLHERYPNIRIIIFSGRFDNPVEIRSEKGEGKSESGERARRVNEIGRVVMEALRLGASAFVSKNAAGGFSIENILRAIACLERGEQFYFNYPVMLTLKEAAEHWFDLVGTQAAIEVTEAERQLLLLEAAGCTASEISNQLGESDKAIQEHQKDLSQRFEIVNKSGARVAKALSLGLINPADVRFLSR
ncbi:MAG: DNA-binding response regulator [bacterium]